MADKGNSCKECREWMVDILYPEDLERIPAGMEAHVKECADCSEELESLRQILTAIRKVDLQIKPPARLESAIMSAIEREVRSERAARPAVGFFDVLKEKLGQLLQATRPLVANPAFAAAMLVLVVGGFLLIVKDYIWEKPLGTPAEERSIVLPPVGEAEAPAPAAQEPAREAELGIESTVTEEDEARAAEAADKVTELERDKDFAAGLDGDEALKKAPAGAKGERAVNEKEAEEKNLYEDQKAAGKSGGLGGYGTGTLMTAESDYPFKDTAGSGKDLSAGETTAAALQDKTEADVSTKGGSTAMANALDETKTGKKPAAKSTPVEGAGASGGAAPTVAASPPAEEKPKTEIMPSPAPSPSPYPFDYGPSATSADTGVKKKKKTTTYWEADEEKAPAAPSYKASDDVDGIMALEEAESEAYSPPAKGESKKKGGGGWLAKYKAKKEAKKAAKAKKDEAKEKPGAAVAAAEAEAPASVATQAKADEAAKQVKDPYVEARDYYQNGEYDKALKVLNGVLKNPSSTTTSMAYLYHLLGKVWNKKGDKSKALAYYETIFSKYPSYTYVDQARWEAALLYIAKGNKSEAKKLLEKLLSSPQFKEKAQKKLDQL